MSNLPPGFVAVPASTMMFTESVLGLLRLTRGLPPGSRMVMGRTGCSSSIAENRNNLTAQFLEGASYKWILYLDSDSVPKPDTIPRLLSHNVDVVSAHYFQRGGTCLSVYSDLEGAEPHLWGGTELREVFSAGAGCLLVKRHVIEALSREHEYPWEHPEPGAREDCLFCDRVRRLGYKVYVDTGHVVGHMMARAVDEELAMFYQAPPAEEHPRGEK